MIDDRISVMAEALASDRDTHPGRKKLYKAESDSHKAELLSADIGNTADMLKAAAKRNRIDLNDTVEVAQRVDDYLRSCAAAGTFPTVLGLSSFALGCSRQHVRQWMIAHPQHETTKFLEMAFDSFASVLLNAGLFGNAAPILTIFELKNNHAYRDQIQLEPVQHEPMRDEYDPEEIKRRYLTAKNPHKPEQLND